MTTKFLDYIICTFKFYCGGIPQERQALLENSPLCPHPTPLQKCKSYFNCRSAVSENLQWSLLPREKRTKSAFGDCETPGNPSDHFLRRFREGISFPNFVERSIPDVSISKLCAVPFALQNRALFELEKGRKCAEKKGRKRGGQQRGQKGKKDA